MSRSSETQRTANPWGEGLRLREEITDAATRLLARAATRDAVTLRSIAREAGIAAPSIYRHFEDRDAVLDAVVSSTFEQLEAVSAHAFDGADTGIERVRAIAYAYVGFAVEHRAAYRILFERPEGQPGRESPPYPAGIRAFQFFVDGFTQMCSEGASVSHEPERDAQALWAALHGVVTLVPATPGFPWKATEDIVGHLIDALTA